MKIGFLFPGQGSQSVGMGKDLYDTYKEVKNVYDEIKKLTGIDVAKITFESDEETLTQTKNVVGRRYIFWYQATGVGSAPTTSNDVRDGATGKQFETNPSFNINVTPGQQTFWIACPSGKTLKSVIAVNQSNAEIKDNFIKTTLNVEGANGFAATAYNIYTYTPNAAFGNADILKVTLQ